MKTTRRQLKQIIKEELRTLMENDEGPTMRQQIRADDEAGVDDEADRARFRALMQRVEDQPLRAGTPPVLPGPAALTGVPSVLGRAIGVADDISMAAQVGPALVNTAQQDLDRWRNRLGVTHTAQRSNAPKSAPREEREVPIQPTTRQSPRAASLSSRRPSPLSKRDDFPYLYTEHVQQIIREELQNILNEQERPIGIGPRSRQAHQAAQAVQDPAGYTGYEGDPNLIGVASDPHSGGYTGVVDYDHGDDESGDELPPPELEDPRNYDWTMAGKPGARYWGLGGG